MTNSQLAPATKPEELCIEQIRQQLQRILHSNTLRNSPDTSTVVAVPGHKSHCRQLGRLKEYTIGVEAFGRKPDFDPKTDTIVRVQTHRLRQKIKEYYQDEGVHDPGPGEIPRGHYHPIFGSRQIFRRIRNSMATTSRMLLPT